MGRRSYPGGIISGAEPTVNGAGASGMWTLQTAAQKKTANTWPIRGVVAVISNTAPTISNVAVTDSSYNVLNDTPYINSTGGYIRIIGTNFASGAVAYIGGSAAVTTSFISSTELRCQVAAGASNTFPVYVVNSDNSTAIKLAAVTYSGSPSWTTSATLIDQVADSAFSIALSATSDSSIVYTLDTGSSLPPGTTLYSNGVFAGTVTSITVDTAYSFAVVANDAENQESSRTFTVTVALGDPYFYLTPLLLKGDTGNTWITDSSTNKFSITVSGDTRPTAFNPYTTYWSGYFDGTGDYLSVAASSTVAFGTGPYTLEFWFYGDTSAGAYQPIINSGNNFNLYFNTSIMSLWNGSGPVFSASTAVPKNKWTFIQIVRTSTSSNGTAIIINGSSTTGTDSNNWGSSTYTFTIAYDATPRYLTGYVTDFRISNIARTSVIPSSQLTSDANTLFLTCQNNRFIDNGPSAITITKTGDAAVRNFTPWLDTTDTITGSGYFDGTGDYLTITRNTVLYPGSNTDFTIEAWIYMTAVAVNNGIIIGSGSFGTNDDWNLHVNTSYQAGLYIKTTSTNYDNTGTLITLNSWYHIAAVRNGTGSNNLTIYVNGNGQSFTTNASLNNAQAYNITIGEDTSTTAKFTGYISNLRLVNGSAVYTANFTPATSSLTSVTNTQLLTLQYRQGENNHRFIDESPNKAVITRAGNANQGSFTPHAQQGWSVSFDGNGDYINISSNALFALGTGDFTVECWVNIITVSTYTPFMQSTNSTSTATNTIWWFAYYNGNLVLNTHAAGGFTATTPWTPSVNRWYHVAAVRHSGTMKLFIDGVAGTVSTTGTPSGYNLTQVGVSIGMIATPYYFTGYISNARIVSGTAVYTATFAVPTTSLSVVAGTVLLTAQSNRVGFDTTGQGLTINLVGDAKTQAISPFRAFTNNVYNPAYSPLLHGGSVYFDGSGDALNVTNTAAVTLFTNDHTVEFWMYPDGTQNQYACPWYYNGSIVYYFSIGSNAPADMTLLVGGGSPWSLQITIGNTEYVKILNNWTHVVITRSGTAFRIFLNGVLRAYGTASTSISAQTSAFYIGWDGTNATTYYKGWLSDFRLINGSIPTAYQTAATATGTAVFTPPSAPVTAEANTVIRTTFTNSGIYDAGGRVNLETMGDARVTNAQNKFGGSSLYFDGTGDYLRLPILQQYNFGTGDFTFECWVYMNSYNATSGSQLFGGHVYQVSADYVWFIDSTGKVGLQISSSTSGRIISTSSVPLTTWTHIAVVRASGTVTPYINGTNAGGAASYTTAMPITTVPTIGSDSTGAAGFSLNGYIDDLRISRYARYTANFTAPTTGFLTK